MRKLNIVNITDQNNTSLSFIRKIYSFDNHWSVLFLLMFYIDPLVKKQKLLHCLFWKNMKNQCTSEYFMSLVNYCGDLFLTSDDCSQFQIKN